jgi:hypothetical protein
MIGRTEGRISDCDKEGQRHRAQKFMAATVMPATARPLSVRSPPRHQSTVPAGTGQEQALNIFPPAVPESLIVRIGRSLTATDAGRKMKIGEEGWPVQFVRRKDVWLLIDENAPEQACVIATLRDEIELLALREFCQFYLQGRVPEHFPIRHGSADYTVTPLGAPGEKLALVIRGDGYSSSVATEFRMAGQSDDT